MQIGMIALSSTSLWVFLLYTFIWDTYYYKTMFVKFFVGLMWLHVRSAVAEKLLFDSNNNCISHNEKSKLGIKCRIIRIRGTPQD